MILVAIFDNIIKEQVGKHSNPLISKVFYVISYSHNRIEAVLKKHTKEGYKIIYNCFTTESEAFSYFTNFCNKNFFICPEHFDFDTITQFVEINTIPFSYQFDLVDNNIKLFDRFTGKEVGTYSNLLIKNNNYTFFLPKENKAIDCQLEKIGFIVFFDHLAPKGYNDGVFQDLYPKYFFYTKVAHNPFLGRSFLMNFEIPNYNGRVIWEDID